MAAILRQVALVSESNSIQIGDVMRVSAALQKQATRDLGPIWDVSATVDAFAKLEDVPLGYWPILIRDNIGFNAAGIHLDKDGAPYALVSTGEDWSLTASHEMLEMLVDPSGNRVVAGDSPNPDQGRVEFLVEVSDPSESADYAYTVNGVLVSDFYTPNFFDPIAAPGTRYSFTGAITEPRLVLPGGYLSWHDLISDNWFQLQYFDGTQKFVNLGKLTAKNGSMRAQIDHLTGAISVPQRKGKNEAVLAGARSALVMNKKPSENKASSWRAQIDELLGIAPSATAAAAEKPSIARRPRRVKGD